MSDEVDGDFLTKAIVAHSKREVKREAELVRLRTLVAGHEEWIKELRNERDYWKMMHDEKQLRLDAKSATQGTKEGT
jgi:hypothetical protein